MVVAYRTQTPSAYAEVRPDLCGYDAANTRLRHDCVGPSSRRAGLLQAEASRKADRGVGRYSGRRSHIAFREILRVAKRPAFKQFLLIFSLLTSHFSLFAAASSLGDAESLRVISPSSYTNHAGLAITGYPIALTAKTTTISNQYETLTLKLSIFPEMERRRLVADWITSHPADIALLRVPRDIRLAVEKNALMIRRSQNRAAKKMCTPEESAAYCAQSRAALKSYLDAQEKSGRLLPAERRLLVGGARR